MGGKGKKKGKKGVDKVAQSLEQLTVEPSEVAEPVTSQSTETVTSQSTETVTSQSTETVTSQSTEPATSKSAEDVKAQPSEPVTSQSASESTDIAQPSDAGEATQEGAEVTVRKRVRNRKKKQFTKAPEQDASTPVLDTTSAFPAPPEPVEDLQPSYWGRSSTAPFKTSAVRPASRPPFSSGTGQTDPAQPTSQQSGPPQQGWPLQQAGPPQQGGWPQQQTGFPQQSRPQQPPGPPQQGGPQQQGRPQQQGPPQQQPGPPQQAWPQQQPGPPQQAWAQQQPGPPQQGWPQQQAGPPQQGGWPQQQQGLPQQSRRQQPPGPPQQGRPQQQPGPQQQSRPQKQPGPSQQGAPQQQTVARLQTPSYYSIPAKILKNTVQGIKKKPVLTNYLPLNIKAIICYRYDVSFVPEKPKKLLPRAFYAMLNREYPKTIVAYDQVKIMFTVKPLYPIEKGRKSYKVKILDDNDREMEFEVAIKPTGTVDLNTILQYMQNGTSLQTPTEAIQCVDVVLRQGTLLNYKKAGRAFFKQPSNPIVLGDGLEMWTGLFQSAIFASRPFVNIDVAHKGFAISKPLIEHLYDFKLDPSKGLERQRGFLGFKSFVKGLRVVVNVGGDKGKEWRREFIINDIKDPADVIKFTYTDQATGVSKEMTVETYFQSQKKFKLRFPKLNVIWVGPRDKSIYYPIELATVAHGQVLNRRLTERQVSTMVRQAATPPNIRKAKIEELIHSMQYSKNEYYNHFGLSISENFTKVDAKMIPPPQLDYGGQTVEPRNGQWMFKKLLKGMQLLKWGFVGVNSDPNSCNSEFAIKTFRNVANDIGMSMAEPALLKFTRNVTEIDKIMHDAVEMKLQLLMVAVPQFAMKDVYQRVKYTAERRIGVLTQCVKDSTLERLNQQTARNIMLKVNSKLMGINQAINDRSLPACLQGGRVMVVGADVTHSTPDQSTIPSIAAVTASIDPQCFQYNINLSIQAPRVEVIAEFEDLMLEHLKVYRDKQKCLPLKIYVFRDGVSEGQFEQVMNSELRAIYNAYATLTGGKGKPEVMFLLVQKRHHTRMFSTDSTARNVDPGTVIDTDIVHPKEVDFYLVSHQAIKGTARPTRYHAVCNDGAVPVDQIEQLAYYLCHMYSRCTRSVSYPTPTYYAHLACLRARVLTHGEVFDNKKLEMQPQRLRVLDKILVNSRMFFV